MKSVNITFLNGDTHECAEGTPVHAVAQFTAPDDVPFIAALVNNNVASMSYPLTVDATIELLTMSDPHGWRVYRHSLCFVLGKVVRELFPDVKFTVEHSFGLGLYCSFEDGNDDDVGISKEQLHAVDTRMREIVDMDIPIERRKLSFTEAVKAFRAAGQENKYGLLQHRNPPHIVIHWCDGFSDLAHGPLAPSTGVLKQFELVHYKPGFVLHLPDRGNPHKIPPFEDQPHLFKVFQEHKRWGRILQISTVGKLNEIAAGREMQSFIRTAEALHEKKISQIADQIAEHKDKVKIVLIAGPSSAGKTTFAKRLTTHLAVNGLQTATVSTDDYFVGEELNPVDEMGKPDYEHIEAVDIELFNKDLLKLVHGEEVDIPQFNFELKRREYDGHMLHVDEDQIIIIEGIHGLNPRLTHMVPQDTKFRIYVSALTQLSLDDNNRISTTDNRLMRRIIRDNKFRGHSTLETLEMWPSVRRGEKRWIFPFQREADATFNSALDYELAVLKPVVEPLLMQVKPSMREYAEARRLSEFLLNFLAVTPEAVPATSILREYIGGSDFHY